MDEDADDKVELTDEVELVSDGENLLVVGEDRRSVESFLRAKGLLEAAREIGRHVLVPALRSSAGALKTVSDAFAESSLWLKVTPESAEAIKEFGLVDSGVPGVTYAVAGTRGSIKEWIKVETTARVQLANPGVLSGAAGMLSQAAHQQEAAQLRELLAEIEQKLDKVLWGQTDDILGDLGGIEHQIHVSRRRLETESDIDALTWSNLFGTSVGLRQVQEKALLKLERVAKNLEAQKRFVDLRQRLWDAKGEVQLWLSVVVRCVTALDELAILELDYCAAVEPDRLDDRRASLDHERQDDQVELDRSIAALMQRMDEAAKTANQNKLVHVWGVPRALASIDAARSAVKRVYEALGVEIDWEALDPAQWRAAILQVQQWKNGLLEGGSLAWEKGKPVLGTIVTTLLLTAVTAVVKGKIEPPGNSQS
ncbi:Putative uncharacterized protein [Propionibacterium freudenreichii]|uniref:hypothetical protein n=1 Tax=Propionibacterium freudenreichii TaxID=1744 RepID=UPI0005A5C716|nr:hypothetical protein [Propionibacterium freudenreichii]MDK9674743.1 hypothetical protein [Propionibacterium freudenreichii]CEI47064.1 Putative uncharacterized protein [Propionibacterium freudenreichii]SCQ46467.1 Hypothetical protein PFR_JS7-1_1517 [Propionibacterium freudenreichii]SCQ52871.1 Hypothetical protein PFR_JS7-2_1517 [Propionibacterium freudenreichii]